MYVVALAMTVLAADLSAALPQMRATRGACASSGSKIKAMMQVNDSADAYPAYDTGDFGHVIGKPSTLPTFDAGATGTCFNATFPSTSAYFGHTVMLVDNTETKDARIPISFYFHANSREPGSRWTTLESYVGSPTTPCNVAMSGSTYYFYQMYLCD